MSSNHYRLKAGTNFHVHCNKWTTAREVMALCESLTVENEEYISREFMNSLGDDERFRSVKMEFFDRECHPQPLYIGMRGSIINAISRIGYIMRVAPSLQGQGGGSVANATASG